jgi:hypothetical protein
MAGFMVAWTTLSREARGVPKPEITRRLLLRGLVLILADTFIGGLPRAVQGFYSFMGLSSARGIMKKSRTDRTSLRNTCEDSGAALGFDPRNGLVPLGEWVLGDPGGSGGTLSRRRALLSRAG